MKYHLGNKNASFFDNKIARKKSINTKARILTWLVCLLLYNVAVKAVLI
jgi:hypothetical protein